MPWITAKEAMIGELLEFEHLSDGRLSAPRQKLAPLVRDVVVNSPEFKRTVVFEHFG